MVFPDWTSAPPKPEISFVPAPVTLESSLLARPVDRLAAAIVDVFVVLMPMFILLSAPFKKWLTLSFLVGSETEIFFNFTGMVALAFILVSVYQTFLHFIFATTLGKRLFNIRIASIHPGNRLSLWDCFVRSWVWMFSCFMLLIPFLAVFANLKRRPWHDRIADTVVLSNSRGGVGAPAIWEQAAVRAVFMAFLSLAALIVYVQVNVVVDKIKADSKLSALVESEKSSCSEVSKNMGEEDETKEHFRLDLAMLLYAAGIADRTCLEAEVEREVASQVAVGPITYLAQAFIHADDAEISNSYLDEVCSEAPESVECSMSAIVSQWSDEDWAGVEDTLYKAPKGSGYLEIWGVRHFMKQARYLKALELLDKLSDRKLISDFSLAQRVKGLFNSYKEVEAEVALMQAVSALPKEDSRSLSAWMCAQQLQVGCSALESKACNQISDLVQNKDEIDFENSEQALVQVLAMECRNDGKINYLSLVNSVESEDWRTFFQANVKKAKNDKVGSGHLYSKLIFSSHASDLLKVEAMRRWVQLADYQQSEDLFEQWRVMDSKENWVKSGNLIFRRMAETGRFDLALKVAKYLVDSDSMSPQALAVLTSIKDNKKSSIENRMPASKGSGD